jgi:hypothetical protein
MPGVGGEGTPTVRGDAGGEKVLGLEEHNEVIAHSSFFAPEGNITVANAYRFIPEPGGARMVFWHRTDHLLASPYATVVADFFMPEVIVQQMMHQFVQAAAAIEAKP